jgi:hypothetical protein
MQYGGKKISSIHDDSREEEKGSGGRELFLDAAAGLG